MAPPSNARLAQLVKPHITLERALRDYEQLKTKDYASNPKIFPGNAATDYFFFEHRLACRLGRLPARLQTFRDYVRAGLQNDADRRLYDHKRTVAKMTHMRAMYYVYQLYGGTVSTFKPALARELYRQFRPTTVLDPCAGWGGRLMGAMSLGVNYIGFDTNVDLKPAYDKMIQTLAPVSPKCAVRMFYRDSSKEDLSKLRYDMVLTSPPYFCNTCLPELYPHMQAADVASVTALVRAIVSNAWRGLQPGGVFAINVHVDMYPVLREALGACQKRLHTGARHRVSSGEAKNQDYVYVWRKAAAGRSSEARVAQEARTK